MRLKVPTGTLPRRAAQLLAGAALALAATAAPTHSARALSIGEASFTLTTGNDATNQQDLFADSNKCPTEGPTAMYLGGLVTNNSGATLTDVTASISGVTLSGGQASTITIGSLAPGESYFVAFDMTYSCINGTSYTAVITLSDSDPGQLTRNITATVKTAQSANAGGQVITATLGAGAVVGQIIETNVSYDFGNISIGNEFFLQPKGSTAFNAQCFQLVGSEITASNITAIAVGSINQLYFVSPVKQAGNGYTASVRYKFRYLCAGASTTARPLAGQTSGSTNIKYTGNFDGTDSLNISFPPATNPFTITKSVSPIVFANSTGGTATYTVTISNPSAYATTLDQIIDVLPSGVTFQAIAGGSGVTTANSSSTPSSGASGTISFRANIGASYALPAGGSISLVYTANIPSTPATYVNSASAAIGLETVGPATTSVYVLTNGALTVSKNVSIYDPTLAGLYATPGQDVVYTLSLANATGAQINNNTIVIEDALPADLEFFNGDFSGGQPILFSDSGSGLACCAGVVTYSATVGTPKVFNYTPTAGYDPAVTAIRIAPTGTMNGFPASFEISFRMRIK